MKKWTIEITQDEKSFNMNRNNKGFNVMELLAFAELIKHELILQIGSMMNKPDKITRKFITENTEGSVEINKETN